ncbi:hypothetical protein ACFVHQ_10240 [Actinomycetes bacterium NPDC127524]
MKGKIHRCNCQQLWSVQTRKSKITAQTVLLQGEWLTEVKPWRTSNPKGFVSTPYSENIIINPADELLENFEPEEKLLYDRHRVWFNLTAGEHLYFARDGSCYVLKIRTT